MAPGLGAGVLVFAAALLVGASPGFLVGVACGVASGLVLFSALVRRAGRWRGLPG